MAISPYALWSLSQEARALLTRLARVRSFALVEPMLPAANLLPATQDAIERHLVLGRHQLRQAVRHFLEWLGGPAARQSTAEQAQRRFTFLKLRFNAVITQFDLFNDVISQRSENEIGVWLSGLDVVSADALLLPGGYYDVPPVICYLDRGIGAAIRRARTRLPGGGSNPVGDHPHPARTHDRQRHRLVADPRGRPPGRRPARSRELAAPGAAGPAATRGRTSTRSGSCGSAGSPRSSPTSGRSRGSASHRRWA